MARPSRAGQALTPRPVKHAGHQIGQDPSHEVGERDEDHRGDDVRDGRQDLVDHVGQGQRQGLELQRIQRRRDDREQDQDVDDRAQDPRQPLGAEGIGKPQTRREAIDPHRGQDAGDDLAGNAGQQPAEHQDQNRRKEAWQEFEDAGQQSGQRRRDELEPERVEDRDEDEDHHQPEDDATDDLGRVTRRRGRGRIVADGGGQPAVQAGAPQGGGHPRLQEAGDHPPDNQNNERTEDAAGDLVLDRDPERFRISGGSA